MASALDRFGRIDATFANEWTGPSGCPQVFTWQAGEPQIDAANHCAVYEVGAGMRAVNCESATAQVMCEQ